MRLREEIAEQPKVLRHLLGEETAHVQFMAGAFHRQNMRYVVIAARGT
jgi:fructoselysine-6-P-deglycase FrlB-like protein